jgi:hypothetical protein
LSVLVCNTGNISFFFKPRRTLVSVEHTILVYCACAMYCTVYCPFNRQLCKYVHHFIITVPVVVTSGMFQAYAELESDTPGTIQGLTYALGGKKLVISDPTGLVATVRLVHTGNWSYMCQPFNSHVFATNFSNLDQQNIHPGSRLQPLSLWMPDLWPNDKRKCENF